jgi:three-Cys-motif partner protein
MPVHDHHAVPFDQETLEKLRIYEQYLTEFLPVFMNGKLPIKGIQIFDFFAGPGCDISGKRGSPLITCEVVTKFQNNQLGVHNKPVRLFFNEYEKAKYERLSACFEGETSLPSQVKIEVCCMDFKEAFENQYKTMQGYANLIFLDQNGIKQIDRSVFERITALPRTDLLFFVSSSLANRFKTHNEIRKYLPLNDEDIEMMDGDNVHRILTASYKRWLRPNQVYYLGSFSIKKKANVYGLVFGSGHPLGIDKFLRVAWAHGGDANFDIDGDNIDPSAPSLFPEYDKPKKLSEFEVLFRKKLLEGTISTNIDAYLFTLEAGVLGSHARDVLNQMVKDGLLEKGQRFAISYDAWSKSMKQRILFCSGGRP